MSSPMSDHRRLAHKWRHEVIKAIEPLKDDDFDDDEPSQFEKIEDRLAQYRLACMQVVFADTMLAFTQEIERDLWQVHLIINGTYRKVLGRLSPTSKEVVKRKVESLLHDFLKVAQHFYRGYLGRICARYELDELTPSLRSIHVKYLALGEITKFDAAAMGIKQQVLASCHQSLICLGDLARYRTLARPAKQRSWDGVIATYDLAIRVNPLSGHGHHQLGLVYQGMGAYFETVYHMYRASSCVQPNVLALGNLSRAFRDVRRADLAQQHKRGSELTTIKNWFIKLHARFFRGEKLEDCSGMEEEILHRFACLLPSSGDDEVRDCLLKMVIISVAAYDESLKRADGKCSTEASHSCQDLLRWNIRILHQIAVFVRKQLTEFLRPVGGDPTEEIDLDKIPLATNRGLSLLGVYMTWLGIYTDDLLRFRVVPGSKFEEMGRSLAQTLNVVIELVYRTLNAVQETPASVQLVEDEETMGLDCLRALYLPERCRLHNDPLTGELKAPRPKDGGESNDGQAAFTRAAHISCCAVYLGTDDSKFPFIYQTKMTDSKPESTILFIEDSEQLVPYSQEPATETTAQDPPSSKMEEAVQDPSAFEVTPVETPTTAPDTPGQGPSAHVAATLDEVPSESIVETPIKAPSALAKENPGQGSPAPVTETPVEIPSVPAASTSTKAPPSTQSRYATTVVNELEEDVDMDEHIYSMVNEFLVPPESPIATTAAKDKKGELSSPVLPESRPPSSPSQAQYQNLPWDFFYTPAPLTNQTSFHHSHSNENYVPLPQHTLQPRYSPPMPYPASMQYATPGYGGETPQYSQTCRHGVPLQYVEPQHYHTPQSFGMSQQYGMSQPYRMSHQFPAPQHHGASQQYATPHQYIGPQQFAGTRFDWVPNIGPHPPVNNMAASYGQNPSQAYATMPAIRTGGTVSRPGASARSVSSSDTSAHAHQGEIPRRSVTLGQPPQTQQKSQRLPDNRSLSQSVSSEDNNATNLPKQPASQSGPMRSTTQRRRRGRGSRPTGEAEASATRTASGTGAAKGRTNKSS